MSQSSERGSVLILVALSTVVLLSIAALSIDASFMFDLRDRMSAVADSAAVSAAYEVKHKNAANLAIFALAERQRAEAAGLIPTGVMMDAHLCTAAGATCTAPYIGTGYVEVIVEKTQPTFFSPIMGFTSLTPRARAVAGIASPTTCFTSLHDLTMWTARIQETGCTVRVGGDLHGKTPPATIEGSVMVAGHCDGDACTNGNFHNLSEEQAYPDNPFATLTPLTPSTLCGPMPSGGGTVPAGCYTTIPNHATITLGPGVFFVSGTWDLLNNNVINATSGTLIYLRTGSQLNAGNNSALHIVASDTITGYEGIAIAGDPGSSMTVNNQFTLDLTGATALGNTSFTAVNTINIPNTGCNIMVFNSFEMKAGLGTVSGDSCATLFTGAPYLSVALAE